MDEPLGTLDADRRLAMCEFLREQQLAARVTTLYVTHDQEEAMRLADRIVVMKDGMIEQVGTPLEVYDEPATLFVAHFVGSPGMNFLEGERVGAGAVTLGVRPESVRVAAEEGPAGDGGTPAAHGGTPAISGEVVLDEYSGIARCLHVRTDAGTLVARVAADAPTRLGARVRLGFDPARVRRFDRASGRRLS
jgi:multiple sugar transport system ATP-binding protein